MVRAIPPTTSRARERKAFICSGPKFAPAGDTNPGPGAYSSPDAWTRTRRGTNTPPGPGEAGVDRRRVPDPVPGTERLETGSEHVRDANHPRSHPRPRPRRSNAFFTAPPLAAAVADDPPPKPPIDESRRRVDAALAARLAADAGSITSGRPSVDPRAMERPDAAKLRRAKEARRRAKLDAVQDGWRSLLDEGSRRASSSNGSGSGSRRRVDDPPRPEPTPGPGSYAAPSAFRWNERISGKDKARGTKPDRNGVTRQGRLARTAEASPGPGAYGDARGAFVSPPKKGFGATRGVAFTAAPRFAEGDRDSPGPGRYDPTTGAKAVPGTRAHFGTSGARFRIPASVCSPPREVPSSEVVPKSSVPARAGGGFARGIPREPDPRPRTLSISSTPGPGAYDAPDVWRAASHRRGAGGVLSDDPRLDPNPPRRAPDETDPNASPGPGAYDVGRRAREAIPKGRSSLRSRSARMATRTSDAPGPGRYDGTHPHSRMLRRSFNVTVDGAFEPPR